MAVRVWVQLRVSVGVHRVCLFLSIIVRLPEVAFRFREFVVAGCSICVFYVVVSCEILF